jgi:hypothetical protein
VDPERVVEAELERVDIEAESAIVVERKRGECSWRVIRSVLGNAPEAAKSMPNEQLAKSLKDAETRCLESQFGLVMRRDNACLLAAASIKDEDGDPQSARVAAVLNRVTRRHCVQNVLDLRRPGKDPEHCLVW